MNRVYRLVWNTSRACWMVASEFARSACPCSTPACRTGSACGADTGNAGSTGCTGAAALRLLAKLGLGMTLAGAGMPAFAESTAMPSGGTTRSHVAPNGVTVVDIAAPNAAGVSSNQYGTYNVDARGLVLNNAAGPAGRQSQLAGHVEANTNLSGEARLILNQVNGGSRSMLNGFTEVLGRRADVVVANPYGITCGGCGFINSSRVTLSTGTPVMGQDGSLTGLSVTRGDILIEGRGINASTQQILDLVSRSVRIDGQVNANDLGIHAGPNQWSYASRATTGSNTPEGSAPAYAIDTSALGGMYANRIFLISTEAGVGVRLLGNAAANAGEFVLSASGKVLLGSRISASTDLEITATADPASTVAANADTAVLQLGDASLSAGHDLALLAYGGLHLAGSTVVAGNDLAVGAQALTDGQGSNLNSGDDSTSISASNDLYAARHLNIAILGPAHMNGSGWGAGGNLWARFDSLATGDLGALFYATGNLTLAATAGDLALGKAQVQSGADLTLTSAGLLSTAAGPYQGVMTTGGNLFVNAAHGIVNGGAMTALAGGAALHTDGAVVNSGQLFGKTAIEIGSGSTGEEPDVYNFSGGAIVSEGALTLRGAVLENRTGARVQAATSTVSGKSLLNAGTWLLSTEEGDGTDSLALTAGLENGGILQSARSLVLTAQAVGNHGTLMAAGSLEAATETGFDTGAGSYTGAGKAMVLRAAGVNNGGQLSAASLLLEAGGSAGLDNRGMLLTGPGAMTLKVANRLENSGVIHAGGALAIGNVAAAAVGSLDIANVGSGAIVSDAALNIAARDFINAGAARVQAGTGSHLELATLDNDGVLLLSTASGAADALAVSAALVNSGVIESAGTLALSAASAANSGVIMAADDLNAGFAGAYRSTAGSFLQSARMLGVHAGSIDNGGTAKAQSILLEAGSGLLNSGIVEAEAGSATVRAGGFFDNRGAVYGATLLDIADAAGKTGVDIRNSGQLRSGAGMLVAGSALRNTGTGWMQAVSGSRYTLAGLENAGTMLLSQNVVGQNDELRVTDTLGNTGTLQSARAFDIFAASLDNGGRLLADGNLGLSLAGGLTNRSGAAIQSGQSLLAGGITTLSNAADAEILARRLVLSSTDLDNGGTIQGGDSRASFIIVANRLANRGGATIDLASAAAGAGTLNADTIENAGTLQSHGDLSLAAGAGGLTNSGRLLADGTLAGAGRSGTSLQIKVDGAGVIQGRRLDLAAETIDLAGTATLQSLQDMTLNLGSLNFASSSARVFAASSGSGTGSIVLRNALNHNAAILSGHDLSLSAPAIVVRNTGGIAALHDLRLESRSGDISNSGSLYAANRLELNAASGTINNVGNLEGAIGTLDAGGSISLSARTIVNNSDIRSDGDITLAAGTIRNEPLGGDTRLWSDRLDLAERLVSKTPKGYNGCDCADQTEIAYFERTWNQKQYYAAAYPVIDGQPTPPRPQILAGGTIALRNFSAASNLAGLISAPTVTLTGNAGASFTNDDLSLQQSDFRQTWEYYIQYIAAGPAVYINDPDHNNSGPVRIASTTLFSPGSGIYANTLNGSGFTLINKGSPFATATQPDSVAGGTAELDAAEIAVNGIVASGHDAVAGTDGADPASLIDAAPARPANAVSFGGIRLALPSNPNGFFVPAREPTANYLIETNPALVNGRGPAPVSGSDLLLAQFGFDADITQRRLGDASYEAWLIGQQVVAQTRRNVLEGHQDETAMLESLFGNAITQGRRLGLNIGQAPTKEQLASLAQDMVWLVSTEVSGEKVLVPQVFLADSTRRGIESGALIVASNIDLDLDRLNNTGATIVGTDSLDIRSARELGNFSGQIRGGDISLRSATANIVNQTLAESSSGNDGEALYATVLGQQARIDASGKLDLYAGGDIRNLGAAMSAGGDVRLASEGTVRFDTVENKNIASTQAYSDSGNGATATSTTTGTVQQLTSQLDVGGRLDVRSGRDIVFAGTAVKTGGDASLAAIGDIGVLARTDVATQRSDSTSVGAGVDGALYGSSRKETDASSLRNVGSSFEVGGNAAIVAGGDLRLEGSRFRVLGDAAIDAGSVKVLAGQNSDTARTVTTTRSYFSTSTEGTASADASGSAKASAADGKASAEANGEASAKASGKAGLQIATLSRSETVKEDLRHVGSQLDVGGKLSLGADRDLTLKGSSVAVGGDAAIRARDVAVLAVADRRSSTTESSNTAFGLMAGSDNNASVEASAKAKGDSGGAGQPGALAGKLAASASVSAEAEASSKNELTLMRTTSASERSLDITHTGSLITSGGTLGITATDTLRTEGSALNAGKNLNLDAGTMEFRAVQDQQESSAQTSTTKAGLYADGTAEAEAGAKASFKGGNMEGDAKIAAGVEAKGAAGIRAGNVTTDSLEGASTALVSSLSAGGNIDRQAGGTITDTGTRIDAGGDFSQRATDIVSLAAENTRYSSSASTTHKAQLGGTATAEAAAAAKANGSAGIGSAGLDGSLDNSQGSEAGAGLGVEAKYVYGQTTESASASDAVVSSIKTGGNVSSISSGATRLSGTVIEAGNDVRISAGTLDYKAARDTVSSTENSTEGLGKLSVSSDASRLGAAGAYEMSKSSEAGTTAVTGLVRAGGALDIVTGGDAVFEGSRLASGGDMSLVTGGRLDFRAASDTSTSNKEEITAQLALGHGSNEKGSRSSAAIKGGYSRTDTAGASAVAGSLESGKGIRIETGDDVTLVGTRLESAGDTVVKSAGALRLEAARSTDSSISFGIAAALGGGNERTSDKKGETSKSSGKFKLAGDHARSESDTAQAAVMAAGGNLSLSSAGDTTLEGSRIAAAGEAAIVAGGDVNVLAAIDTKSAIDFAASLAGKTTTKSSSAADQKQDGMDSAGGASGNAGEAAAVADGTGQGQSKTSNTFKSSNNFIDLEGSRSGTAEAASINAGSGLRISSGASTTLAGTALASGAGITLDAAGNVTFGTADSSRLSGGFGANAGNAGAMLNQAGFGVGESRQGVTVLSAGDLTVNAGGTVRLQASKVESDGNVALRGDGGVQKESVLTSSMDVGLTNVRPSVEKQETVVTGAGRRLILADGERRFDTSVSVPASLPPGSRLTASTAEGKPLPGWLKFDGATGKFSGKPPDDFSGTVRVNVGVPQPDGTMKQVPLTFSAP